jgi:hypothetical protein
VGGRVKTQAISGDTAKELREFILSFLPNAIVDTSGSEVIIKTGLGLDMGDYLYPIEDEELTEIRGI